MCDVYIDTGITHTPGLRFAINIDPAMFQVNDTSLPRNFAVGLSYNVKGTVFCAP